MALPYRRLAAAAIVDLDDRTIVVYGSVLPWRSAPRHAPELSSPDETAAAMFERVLTAQVRDIRALQASHPDALLIWAGDFNQSLDGPNMVGSAAGRSLLSEALDRLGFAAWNQGEAHAVGGLLAIDLICGPRRCLVEKVDRFEPVRAGKRLSDHAGYVVDVEL